MGYLNRIWMAASVTAMNGGHSDQGHKWHAGLRSLQSGKRVFSSAGESSDLRPLSVVMASNCGGSSAEEKRKQADDSLRQVMYLSCWGQS